jgi:histone arginine demethylase JMJD6
VSRGEWARHGYAARADAILSVEGLVDEVPRVDARAVTPAEFAARFERPRLPAVVTGLTAGWRADGGSTGSNGNGSGSGGDAWDLGELLAKYGSHKFKVGTDDDGYAVRLRFDHFLRYVSDPRHAPSDDSPLYVFDGTFADRDRASAPMGADYDPRPPPFVEDLLALAGERRRPPHRCAAGLFF